MLPPDCTVLATGSTPSRVRIGFPLCSAAARTRETLEILRLPPKAEVVVEDGLYGASAGGLLARLRRVLDTAAVVMVVAHNPGIEDLARLLDAGGLHPVDKYPTGGLAVLGVRARRWRDLAPGTAALESFVVPRTLG